MIHWDKRRYSLTKSKVAQRFYGLYIERSTSREYEGYFTVISIISFARWHHCLLFAIEFGLIHLRPGQHDDGYKDGRSQIKVHTDERTHIHNARSSLVVTHPSTNRGSVVVKAKLQKPRTNPRPGPSRPRPRPGLLRSRPRPRPGPFKAKAEAEAWTLETKTKARTLESKANFKAKYDSQFNANIPHAIDMTIAPIS